MPVQWILVLAAFLFAVGVYGVLARRNAVLVLMSVELMLNAVNINLVAFNNMFVAEQSSAAAAANIGQIFALFIITVAAAELGLGLAIVILIYRNRTTVSIDEVSLMKW